MSIFGVSMLAFDRSRLDSLRSGIGAALDDLHGIRSDNPAASDAMRIVRGACRTLGEMCLPRVQDVLSSESMTSYRCTALVDDDPYRSMYSTAHDRGWEVTTDPVVGPALPGGRTFDEVLTDIASGALIPMAAPLDANGRAGAHYTSLTFAAERTTQVADKDITSNLLKFLDFVSDGLPIGWRRHQELTVYYLTNARITSSVHVLSAFDRDEGPETLLDRTTEANVSGYMVIRTDSSTADVSVGIGPGIQDVTQSFSVASQELSSYSGTFYPDTAPDFEPVTHEPRFVNPDMWTFTTSAAPMVEGWGTWGR